MTFNTKDIERLKKNALISLELSHDTKTQITTSEILKFSQKLKALSAKKDVVVIVLENS